MGQWQRRSDGPREVRKKTISLLRSLDYLFIIIFRHQVTDARVFISSSTALTLGCLRFNQGRVGTVYQDAHEVLDLLKLSLLLLPIVHAHMEWKIGQDEHIA